MSYVAQKSQIEPKAVFAAIALNGGVILALALTTVVVKEIAEDDGPLIVKDIKSDDQLPPEAPPAVEDAIAAEVTPTTLPEIITRPVEDTPVKPAVDQPTAGTMSTGDAGSAADSETSEEGTPPPTPIFQPASRHPGHAHKFQPSYPSRLLQREIEGSATVRILIGKDGRVREANIVSATHPAFGKATVKQALRKWRFTPATRDGLPVEEWQTQTVRFTIT